jgi:stress-induced morphogen
MISNEAIVSYLRATIPDAAVSITDRTGTRDHFSIRVVSAAFQDKNLLDRNRLIYHALREPMADGRIHAMELKAHTPDEASVASS